MNTYTVFCCDPCGGGTVWIDNVEASTLARAKKIGREKCAADWSCKPSEVHVLGVAYGDVDIAFWEDVKS